MEQSIINKINEQIFNKYIDRKEIDHKQELVNILFKDMAYLIKKVEKTEKRIYFCLFLYGIAVLGIIFLKCSI